MENWQLAVLETDAPARTIGDYFEHELGKSISRGVIHRYGYEIDSNPRTIDGKINSILGNSLERKLAMYGNGSYHHYTYGLCRHADRFSDDYAYIHFDHHTDYEYFPKKDMIDCSTFVGTILSGRDTNASTALFIGSRPIAPPKIFGIPLLMPFSIYPSVLDEEIRSKGLKTIEKKLRRLPKDVYMSFDLDVMDRSEIYTEPLFDNGSLKTDELLGIIDVIKKRKRIIGADILGFAGTRESSKGPELYAQIAESVMGN